MALDGTRSGNEILTLHKSRQIATDNLWALRALAGLWIAVTVLTNPTGLATYLPGVLLIVVSAYWLAVNIFSSSRED